MINVAATCPQCQGRRSIIVNLEIPKRDLLELPIDYSLNKFQPTRVLEKCDVCDGKGLITVSVPIDPDWLTANVIELAKMIHDHHHFQLLPFLADALEERGCIVPEIIESLRNPLFQKAGHDVVRGINRFVSRQFLTNKHD